MRVRLHHLLIAFVTVALLAGAGWYLAPYNVAASVKHLPPVRALLHGYMKNAVAVRAAGLEPPAWFDPSDPALQRLGAAHFATGCATCHGAPGMPRNAVVRAMLPEPTPLEQATEYTPEEFYWLARHGLKYTGMPAWSGEGRDDEPWAVAAFLANYHGIAPARYREMAYGRAKAIPGVAAVAFGGMTVDWPQDLIAACTRCHGEDGLGRDGTAPKLAGQSEGYLVSALEAYAQDLRQSGFMEPVAIALTAGARKDLAARFAAMDAPGWAGSGSGTGDALRGRKVALQGDEHKEVPSCASCHGTHDRPPRNAQTPRIAGQDARWIEIWLRQWRDGPVPGVQGAERMAAAARRLEDRDIEDLAAYYATATGEAGPTEEPAGQ